MQGGEQKEDSGGTTYYLHRLIEQQPHERRSVEPRYTLKDASGEKADPAILHKVYSALLNNLPLVAMHMENLQGRGLLPIPGTKDFASAYPAGFRTLGKSRINAVNALIDMGMECHFPTVPGFVVKEKDGRSYWSLTGYGGLLIPIRDVQGRIVAITIRSDDANAPGGKYKFLSSKKAGGAGSGAPVHVPISHKPREIVRVTEGALKAEVATALGDILTIGTSGLSTQSVAKVLGELGATTARLAYDADADANHHVAIAIKNLAARLRKAQIAVQLETWNKADGKGIDDLLKNGKQPTLHVGDDVDAAIERLIVASQSTDGAAASPRGPGAGDSPECITDPHMHAREFMRKNTVAFYRQRFWRYKKTHWTETPDAEMRAALTKAAVRLLKDLHVATDENPTRPKVSTGMVSNIMQAVTGECMIPETTPMPSWIDPQEDHQRYHVAFRNGLLDVEEFLAGRADGLRSHTPDWFSPICLPYEFDPSADCPKWLAFLDKNLEGRQNPKAILLQEWCGYMLTPDTSLQRFLMLVGEGSNGKSVILAVLVALLGERNVSSVPLELFGDKFRLAGSVGKLANIVADAGEVDRIAEGQLKSFTSGDVMEFEQKFKDPFSAKPTARLVLSTNNPPAFSDKSDGIWRRLILLRFTVQIADAEKIAGMDSKEFWTDELPGIFNWALAGLHRLRANRRFTIPEESKADAERLRTDSNPARRFLDEGYEAGPGEVATSELYTQYREWCGQRGHHPLAEIGFGREVSRRFPAVKKGKVSTEYGRANSYKGLQKRQEY